MAVIGKMLLPPPPLTIRIVYPHGVVSTILARHSEDDAITTHTKITVTELQDTGWYQ